MKLSMAKLVLVGSLAFEVAHPDAAMAMQASASAEEAAASDEESALRRADLRHAEVTQSGDADAMAALLHQDYAAHLANGRFVGREQMLTMTRSGATTRETFRRTVEKVSIAGGVGVVFGREELDAPPPLATRGERNRRYTNVYVQEGGEWKLLARHFHFLP